MEPGETNDRRDPPEKRWAQPEQPSDEPAFLERALRIALILLIQIVAYAYAYEKSPVIALFGVVVVTMLLILWQRSR